MQAAETVHRRLATVAVIKRAIVIHVSEMTVEIFQNFTAHN